MAASPALAWEACAVSSCTVVEKDSGGCCCSSRFSGMQRQELSIWEKKEKWGLVSGWGRDEKLPRHHHGGFWEGETPRTELVEEGTRSSSPPRVSPPHRKFEGSWLPLSAGNSLRPSTDPDLSVHGTNLAPHKAGPRQTPKPGRENGTRGNSSTAMGKHQDFAGKKAQDLGKPSNPQTESVLVQCCSLCQENPFSSRKRIWASPSQADPRLCKTISFSRWKFMAVLAKNVEREGIQGLLLKLVIIFGDLPSPCSGRSRGAEPVGAALGLRPLCATSSSVKL